MEMSSNMPSNLGTGLKNKGKFSAQGTSLKPTIGRRISPRKTGSAVSVNKQQKVSKIEKINKRNGEFKRFHQPKCGVDTEKW
jgi:hypothetical protein